ncbi:MAG: chemotaxis protein CheA, partial [Alphaproteobacteria bacterium]
MDELIVDFLTETNEGLQTLDLELIKLEKEPNNQEILGGIFRVMHTIKGTCGFLGLPRLESVAHGGENVLGKIRDQKINATPEIISLILKAIDKIKYIINSLQNEGKEPEGNDAKLIELLNHAAEFGIVEMSNVEAISKDNQNNIDNQSVVPTETISDITVPTMPKEGEEPEGFNVETVSEIPQNIQAKDGDKNIVEEIKAEEEHNNAKDEKSEGDLKSNSKSKDNKHSMQSIRVNVDVLEGLMQMVSELVLTRNQLLQLARSEKESSFTSPVQRLSYITSELQERVMKTRMQPISSAWGQFPRLIRDLSLELNKKIELKMVGEETELDRQLIESIKDPLTHMVRNSVDHGLEKPEDRRKAFKSEIGTITLKAYHQGGHIIIEVSDDGRGINLERVKQKAIENGLATESDLEKMTDQQIMQFIFKAGFSTAEKVTSISGRGVGMDVVKTNIEKISGTIEMRSESGKGSNFSIKIPLTLAILSILIVECEGQILGVPQINVVEMVKVGGTSEYNIDTVNGKQILRLRESLLPLISLSEMLMLKPQQNEVETKSDNVSFVVVCEVGNHSFGVIVDRIYDTEEIVVKPVAPILKSLDIYSGSTLLGDGNVIMILDPNGLVKALNKDQPANSNDAHLTVQNNISSKQSSSFLILKADNGSPKAIPLELVSRLEEIDVSKIE